MRLADLQHGLLAALLDGDESVLSALQDDPRRGSRRALAIQSGSVRGIQSRALAETFPVLERLLGADSFGACTRRYLAENPSRSWSLIALGKALPDWLADFAPLANWPYLPEVAQLEWAWHEVFHAANDPPQDWQQLATLDPDQQAALPLCLPTAARLLHTHYPVLDIWQANQPSEPDTTLDLSGQDAQRLLVIRHGEQWPEIHRLDDPDYALLLATQAGTRLGQLTREPAWAARLPGLVERGWLRLGL